MFQTAALPVLSVRALAVCRPGDSASPGWLQPISLRETLLLEKTPVCSKLPPCQFVCPRTGRLPPRRLAIWFLKIAYAPLAAAAGARASWAGRAKGRKGGSSSPLSIFSSRRLKDAPSPPDGKRGGESIFYALSAPSRSSLFSVSLFLVLARPTAGTRCSSQHPSYPRSARSGRRHFPSCPR